VRFLESGAVFFRPDALRYEGLRITPRASELTRDGDPLDELVRAAEGRGAFVNAWTVLLHLDDPGRAPDCAPRNAYGDPYLTELCPANPDARAYVRALVGDIAGRGVDAILAESLHHHGLEHGYHHERYFVTLSPRTRFLLGLCFCESCLARARRRGVAGEEVRDVARREVERVLAGEPDRAGEPEADELGRLAGGEMAGYLESRTETVTSLAADAAAEAESGGSRLVFMDPTGATKGYMTGTPAGAPAAADAWRLGIDLPALAEACGEISALGYAADPERVRLDLDAYAERAGTGRLSLVLRPMLPDCDSVENLAAKLRLARERGVERVDLYHYGLVPLTALDLVREALRTI
jgi:hypothetical protein